MPRLIVAAALILLHVLLPAQVNESFCDGEITSSPPWSGHIEKFKVENGILRLNDDKAGSAFISTPSILMNNTRWDIWLRLAFTPSSNNHPMIYLVSDSQDLHEPLNGYFIRIGKDGTDNKRLYFFRQDGSTMVELMAGQQNLASASNNIIRLRVSRDDQGNWDFMADPTGSSIFVHQGFITDNTHLTTSWFGINCRYTISNSSKFWFDDIYVGEIIPDTIPPEVEGVRVVSSNMLDIHFSEGVDEISSQLVTNYYVNKGAGHPLVAFRSTSRPDVVSLVFENHFIENIIYEINVSGIEDFSGNISDPWAGEFVNYKARRFDVVFSELMADPLPPVYLPPYEYIELFNTTSLKIDLQGWTLQYGETKRPLPAAEILPGDYLVLISEAGFPHLEGFGNVVAVPGLSTTALVNAGAELMLFDQDDFLVSFVCYSSGWYQDPAREEGGWSLEKIDLYNFCEGKKNWKASVSLQGGTPGQTNSVNAYNPDIGKPDLLRAGFLNDTTITLFFSEPMDEASLEDHLNYYLKPPDTRKWTPTPVKATPLPPDFSRVQLHLAQPMQPGVIYQVLTGNGLRDCAANPPDCNHALVAVPQPADPEDVVINEILFNPPAQGVRYAELFNRSSSKAIDLKDYIISSKDTITGLLNSVVVISKESWLLFPHTFVVLTTDPENVKENYFFPNPFNFISLDGFPSMTNTGGTLVFAGRGLNIIDWVNFSEEMHLPLLASKKGVALERLNPYLPSRDHSNWHSAASGAGFGTPGYQNSQYTAWQNPYEEQLMVYPLVFSPDGDGHDDILNISYNFDEPGFIANIRVFDHRGRLVCQLRQGELLGTRGVITWCGTTDNLQKAPIGIYLLHIEVFNHKGIVMNFKRTAVVAGKL